jgi:hypothetical protein
MVKATVFDNSGQERIRLDGKWNESLTATLISGPALPKGKRYDLRS